MVCFLPGRLGMANRVVTSDLAPQTHVYLRHPPKMPTLNIVSQSLKPISMEGGHVYFTKKFRCSYVLSFTVHRGLS